MTLLVCDLGGTGCRMAMAESGVLRATTYRAMQNTQFKDFEDALLFYLRSQGTQTPKSAVIALAAPVDEDSVVLSNHEWRLSKSRISERSGIENVHFLNDLEALGYALRRPSDLTSLPVRSGKRFEETATRLVLGVGTGFNSAACSPSGSIICSEAGHTTFPVETALDAWLQRHFTSQFGRCSLERVLSGSGLSAVYQAVCAEAEQPGTCSGSHEIIAAAGENNLLALRTCVEFCRIFGRSAGDLALAFMPLGGIWLAGGISRALAPMISDPEGSFAKSFNAKGRFSSGMADFPVWVLNDDAAPLRGGLAWLGDQIVPKTPQYENKPERAI